MAKYEEVEKELNQEIIHKYINKLKEAIDTVSESESYVDTRLELLTVLLSFAAQIGQEVEIEDKSFFKLAKEFFYDAGKVLEEDEQDEESLINTYINRDKKELN